MEIVTNSFEETQNLGKKFARKLKRGDVIALYGELGSGKTTFVQGLAKGLGVQKRIISPTFTIIRQYTFPYSSSERSESRSADLARTVKLYHIDLYRIENAEDVQGLGLEEILNDPQSIIAIEWAEEIKDLLPKKRIDIYFEYIDDNKRKISVRNPEV